MVFSLCHVSSQRAPPPPTLAIHSTVVSQGQFPTYRHTHRPLTDIMHNSNRYIPPTHKHPTDLVQTSHKPTDILQTFYGHPTDNLRTSYVYPTDILQTTYRHLTDILQASYTYTYCRLLETHTSIQIQQISYRYTSSCKAPTDRIRLRRPPKNPLQTF